MALHFTYEPDIDRKNLHQGDIIKRTSEVNSILENIHPNYYSNENYKYFIVLTQSCDLVKRRSNNRQLKYISIAAVRPLQKVIIRKADSLLYDEIDKRLGICDDSRKLKLEQFIERLLNNNEPEYFFLCREPNEGLYDDHCGFLRLSIALKTDLHYNQLLNAKILQLKESFQHKLGYLVGNSYSRIGTEDWLPDNIVEDAWRDKINRSVELVEDINFFPKEDYQYVHKQAKSVNPEELSIELLEKFLVVKKEGKSKRKEKLVKIIGDILSRIDIPPDKVKKARKFIFNDSEFSALIK